MAGGSTSEEMDAFDDVTPDKPVSIYDLDEDLPTRTQSSDEIAEYQRLAREKREAAFKAFKPPSADRDRDRISSPSSVRPIPRESGPVPVTPRAEEQEPDLDALLNDVAAGLERLPPAPRVPHFEPERGTLETIHGPSGPPAAAPVVVPARRSRRWIALVLTLVVLAVTLAAAAYLQHTHAFG